MAVFACVALPGFASTYAFTAGSHAATAIVGMATALGIGVGLLGTLA
jgi:hypothetical protein